MSMVVQSLLRYCALCQESLILKTISFPFIYASIKINTIEKKISHLDFFGQCHYITLLQAKYDEELKE